MASYSPPTENLAIFDSSVFLTGDEPLTYNQAVKKFLKYPTAQGTENLLTTNVNGLLTANANIDITQNSEIKWDNILNNYLINQRLPKVITTGGRNVSLGHSALHDIDTGNDNIAIGFNAGSKITSSIGNLCIGTRAGENLNSNYNLLLGSNSGQNITTSYNNIGIGSDTLASLTTGGYSNLAVGRFNLNSLSGTSYDNCAIGGVDVMRNIPSGLANIGIGTAVWRDRNTNMDGNVAIGYQSNMTQLAGNNCTALGTQTNNGGFSDSTCIGYQAQNTANNQIILGRATETVSCPGNLTFKLTSDNTAGTYYIPFSKTTAGTEGRLFIDDTTGPLTYDPSTASMSMGILNLTSGGVTTTYRNNCINTVPASPNIFFSSRTTAPSSGTNNVVMGSNAGTVLSSGNNNVILGLNAGSAFTSGSSNVAVGAGALQSIVTGAENVAIGQGSMGTGIGAGGRNVCVGHQSGQSITATTNGQNVCIGYTAGKSITTGSNVTSVGANANTTGNTTLTNSTAIGANATNANFNSSTAIGANATNTSANQIILGTATETVSCPGSLTFKMTSDNSSGTYFIPFSKSLAGTEGELYVDNAGPLLYNPASSTVSCIAVQVTNVDAPSVSSAVNLFTNSTTGNISIGTGLTSGSLLIGPQGSGSASSNSPIMPRGGRSVTLQPGGNTASAKLVYATNLEVNYPISTSITTTPSSARHLGYTVNQSTAGWTTALTSNTQTNITSVAFTSADYGTYLFEAKIQITPADNTVSRQQILGINTVSANYGVNTDLQYTMANVGHPMLSVMRVLNIYANTTVYLVGYIAGTNGTVVTAGSAGIFSYTRIA